MKRAIPLLALVFACGGDDGEPMDGDVVITVGSSSISPGVGAALEDPDGPDDFVLLIGEEGIDCGTNLGENVPKGTSFSAGLAGETGEQDTLGVVFRSSAGSLHLNGSSAMVRVDSLEDRVTGHIMFDTTDDDDGAITVVGTFDVKRCF